MLGQVRHLGLALLHFLLLCGLSAHDVLDLIHGIVDVERHTDGKRHFVCVVNAHTEKALHGLEFLLVLRGDTSAATLVNELNNTVGYVFSLTVDRSNEEILDLCSRALIVDLILELGLLGGIVRYKDLPGVEGLT